MADQSNLQGAQAARDSIDIDRVRDVAWMAIPYFMQRTFALMARNSGHPETPNPRPSDSGRAHTHQPAPEPDGRRAALRGHEGEAPLFEPAEDLAFSLVRGFDLSPTSLDRAAPAGFSFEGEVADGNDLELDHGAYDLLVGHPGIHHVMNLRHLFEQAHDGLRPSGLLVIDEWIGPAFLQIPRRNAFIARLLLFSFYPKRRSRTNHMGQVKGRWLQAGPEAFDPSEACNANALLPEYHRRFEPLAEVRYGGLCYPVFEGLGHTIDIGRWTNKLRVRMVYWAERMLSAVGLVRPLFASSVGAPR